MSAQIPCTAPPPADLRNAWQLDPWGQAVVGAGGRVRSANRAFLARAGLAEAQLSGMSEADLNHHLATLKLMVQRVEVQTHKAETAGEGTDLPRAVYYLGTTSECDELAQRLETVSELLREPLASIYGFTELLLTQHYDDEMRRELTATLLGQIEAMTNILNEQLDLSR